jgi:pyruvate/2-oxoacid:ferredoxin oxidoreductase beta subunit
MDKFSLYVSNFLPCKEYFVPEKNLACPGCGLALAVRQTYKALEKAIEKATWQSLDGSETAGNTPDVFGVGKTGVSFLNIPKKGKSHLMICLDNEAEGSLDDALEKPMPSLAIAEGFSYVATACPSHPFDLYEKVQRGFETEGNSYIHILCPCPEGWQFDSDLTVKIGKWAVETKAFPLYEVGGGVYGITVETPKPRALKEYLSPQLRFEGLTDQEIENAQESVNNGYKKLEDAVQSYLDTTG